MNLFEDFNTPIVIISKKKTQILNKNSNTRQLCYLLLYRNNKAEKELFNKGNAKKQRNLRR